jgi:hypothetical protein
MVAVSSALGDRDFGIGRRRWHSHRALPTLWRQAIARIRQKQQAVCRGAAAANQPAKAQVHGEAARPLGSRLKHDPGLAEGFRSAVRIGISQASVRPIGERSVRDMTERDLNDEASAILYG